MVAYCHLCCMRSGGLDVLQYDEKVALGIIDLILTNVLHSLLLICLQSNLGKSAIVTIGTDPSIL
jgi:hypothetical protein